MGEELRLLWWNVSWQHRERTNDQVSVVRCLPQLHVLALCELDAYVEDRWREAFPDFIFVPRLVGLPARTNRVLLGVHQSLRLREQRCFSGVRRRAVRSCRVWVGEAAVDVHAAHVPNGQSNGWVKIDHLLALRRGLEPRHEHPQILAGDFNTPRSESPEGILTFGQTKSGRWRTRTDPRLFAERKWDARAWDAGERALLEGLPSECNMPDAFRVAHPDVTEATWVPRGRSEEGGRRLDHIFATSDLAVRSCRHIHEWRRQGLSDHSAIEAVFRLP